MIAPARRAAFAALLEVGGGRRDLGDALADARGGLADPRDVALCHELTIGALRWQGRLDHALSQLASVALAKLDLEVLQALRLGAYQLLYLTRVPAAAAVNDAVALVRQARKSSAAGLVNAVLRRLARGEGRDLPPRPLAALDHAFDAWVTHLAVVHAHPAWLVARWLRRAPLEVVERWLAFDNETPPIVVRVNPLAGLSRQALADRLAAEGVDTTPSRFAPWGLVVRGGAVASSAVLAAGDGLIQDEGSQLVGHLAAVVPGERVLDVCGAPGGKALMYAAESRTGLVVAADVRPARVALLAATLGRGGATRARVVHLDASAPLPVQPAFDVVTVDAPCSGLGTLRRDPDIKWRRTAEDLPRFAARQVDLVQRAAAALRPGGRLVYSTCSTEPEENDQVVERVLAAAPSLRRVAPSPSAQAILAPCLDAGGTFRTDRARDALDGYYGVILERH